VSVLSRFKLNVDFDSSAIVSACLALVVLDKCDVGGAVILLSILFLRPSSWTIMRRPEDMLLNGELRIVLKAPFMYNSQFRWLGATEGLEDRQSVMAWAELVVMARALG
jgi:hypothetical protein